MEDRHEFRRDLLVPSHPYREKNPMGAAPAGLPQRHGRTNPVFSCLVRTGRNHAAGGRTTADNHRLPAVGWVVPLLHRRVKSIHIQMNNLAHFLSSFSPYPVCTPLCEKKYRNRYFSYSQDLYQNQNINLTGRATSSPFSSAFSFPFWQLSP